MPLRRVIEVNSWVRLEPNIAGTIMLVVGVDPPGFVEPFEDTTFLHRDAIERLRDACDEALS